MRNFFATCISLILLTSPAFAQGAIGGSIGKRHKAISGGGDSDRRPNGTAPAGGCSKIAGTWLWNNGLTVVVTASGKAEISNGDGGHVSCNDGIYDFKWRRLGNSVRMGLSSDGKRLSGTGTFGGENATKQ
jgi:hypothetical protein